MALSQAPKLPRLIKTRDGGWALFGRTNQVYVGPVNYEMRDGSIGVIDVYWVSPVFFLGGEPCVFGVVIVESACKHCQQVHYRTIDWPAVELAGRDN